MDIQLLIPMAGLGSRFSREGYRSPKPYLPIGKFTMIEVVVNNLLSRSVKKVILVASKDPSRIMDLREVLRCHGVEVQILEIEGITDGPATTCYLAKSLLDHNESLVIANSDQYLDIEISGEYSIWESSKSDGVIWGMKDVDPKWSYVSTDKNGFAVEIREKKVISNIATCGVYGFTKASDFFWAYDMMRESNDRTNGELYVAPSYNYLIDEQRKFLVRNLGSTSDVMHGLGIPEDYERFLKLPLARKFD